MSKKNKIISFDRGPQIAEPRTNAAGQTLHPDQILGKPVMNKIKHRVSPEAKKQAEQALEWLNSPEGQESLEQNFDEADKQIVESREKRKLPPITPLEIVGDID